MLGAKRREEKQSGSTYTEQSLQPLTFQRLLRQLDLTENA